jgi:YVTN family beta-propeller protein
MNKLIKAIVVTTSLLLPVSLYSQQSNNKLPFENNTLMNNGRYTLMPYNRLIHSAGSVITFGDSSLENHSLDLCLLPDKKNIAVEDRYGIAVLDNKRNMIIARWAFYNDDRYENLVSTYSGITTFIYKNKTYIAWGAAGDPHLSAIMIAEWKGNDIKNVSGIPIQNVLPAGKALPNQVVANEENGILYLYVVLNGNNELLKINFDTKQIVYATPTGVAPYGLCIVGAKAYVTNWAGPLVTDTAQEHAGTPWGSAYTSTVTGGTNEGSVSIIDIATGKPENELLLGLHPTAIIKDNAGNLYITNGNSDYVSVVNAGEEKVMDSIPTGLFGSNYHYYGSSPDALSIDTNTNILYVANAMDNAIAVIQLNKKNDSIPWQLKGYIPTEAYPAGIVILKNKLYVANLEAKGSEILKARNEFKDNHGQPEDAYTIHEERASLSVIKIPDQKKLDDYTNDVKKMNLVNRTVASFGAPDKNALPKPMPDRLGEPSLFRHVIYIIKENKTYDEVFGDIKKGRGDEYLCLYGENITPNEHRLVNDFVLLDNYYASGKSSAEGHQWTDAAMVSDYVERNVRAWFRSYPHRQDDALVYNKNGFIWNDAMDHGKKVRIYGEACLTHYDTRMRWIDIYHSYINHDSLDLYNTTTIGRIRPIISLHYPDCENITFTDQLRATIFINEFKKFEEEPGDSLPDLMVLSLPDDHTAGTSEGFPAPESMVADNDLALGRIIETITHSRFWDSTVVFVTEDDSQSGWDHISSYRTACLIISPYTKMNTVIHTNYNQTSMVRSIEQILNLPPMNVIDATALPMFDCFDTVKHAYQYGAITNKIPLDKMNTPLAHLNGREKYFAKLSANEAFKELDSGDDDAMNKILWFHAKGNENFPPVIK